MSQPPKQSILQPRHPKQNRKSRNDSNHSRSRPDPYLPWWISPINGLDQSSSDYFPVGRRLIFRPVHHTGFHRFKIWVEGCRGGGEDVEGFVTGVHVGFDCTWVRCSAQSNIPSEAKQMEGKWEDIPVSQLTTWIPRLAISIRMTSDNDPRPAWETIQYDCTSQIQCCSEH